MLTSYNGKSFTYDQIGNPLTDGTWTYTWEHGRQLASMTNGSTTWNYTYNADGLRTSRSRGAVTYSYVYNGDKLSQLLCYNKTSRTSEILRFTYDAAGTPLTVTYNGTLYYYVTNIQGDVIGILDSTGAQVVTYTYDAWGKALTPGGSLVFTLGTVNPLRYRGYVYDQETGFYYLQSRYYNPAIGRFINADAFASTGQGLLGNNMFAYCLNNPIIFIDATGTCCYIAPISYWYDCDNWRCPTSSATNPLRETTDQIQAVQATQSQLQNQVILKQIDIIASFVKSEEFEIVKSSSKILSGGKDVAIGAIMVFDPTPVPGEAVAGVYKFAFGITKFLRGIAELIGKLVNK